MKLDMDSVKTCTAVWVRTLDGTAYCRMSGQSKEENAQEIMWLKLHKEENVLGYVPMEEAKEIEKCLHAQVIEEVIDVLGELHD